MTRSGKPDQTDMQNALRLARAGRLADAESCLGHILSRAPNSITALMNMGGIYAAQGRFVEAADCCRRTLELDPNLPVAHYNLASALGEQGLIEAAIDSYREALRLDPKHSDALNNLGNLLRNTGRLGMAADCFNRILEMEPGNVAAYNNRGTVEKDMGLLSEAMASARKAWELEPASHRAASNLLSILNYVPDLAPVVVYEKHRDWARSLEKMVGAHLSHANTPDPDRQLKIGYVSPDFREHSISYFFTPLLMHHDPAQFKTFCYALTPSTDKVARKLQGLAHHWRPIHGLEDAQIIAAIQADGIDILVDLAGHTGDNRLPIFARRPAPVQVSYLGYPNTTGLRTIDYRLTDQWADPLGASESFHAEQLIRLPGGFLCYLPPEDAPPVGPLPSEAAGHITFGSFNYAGKITTAVIAVWSDLLRRVPDSMLLFKNRSFGDSGVRDRYIRLFAEHGIDKRRLILTGMINSRADHLALYNKIDIALDPFPYNGTTTTCEALWMGVPVIVLQGGTHSGRVGASLLYQIGMGEWIGATVDEYIDIAADLAANTARRLELRADLRARLKDSPLCDHAGFTRSVERIYREIWLAWCRQQSANPRDAR